MAENVERRAENRWLDPRAVVAAVALLINLIAMWVGGYMFLSARSSKLEMVGATLTLQAAKMEASQTRIEANVQTIANANAEIRARVDGLAGENRDIKHDNEKRDERLSAIEKLIARLQAKVER